MRTVGPMQFLFEEDARQGNEPGTTLSEMYAEMDQDRAREEARLRQPEYVLPLLQQWQSEDGSDTDQPKISEIVRITHAEFSENFRSSNSCVYGLARCADGVERAFRFSTYHDSGSRIDPPDEGAELELYTKEDVEQLMAEAEAMCRETGFYTRQERTRLSIQAKQLQDTFSPREKEGEAS